jgi:hypothetical protein
MENLKNLTILNEKITNENSINNTMHKIADRNKIADLNIFSDNEFPNQKSNPDNILKDIYYNDYENNTTMPETDSATEEKLDGLKVDSTDLELINVINSIESSNIIDFKNLSTNPTKADNKLIDTINTINKALKINKKLNEINKEKEDKSINDKSKFESDSEELKLNNNILKFINDYKKFKFFKDIP